MNNFFAVLALALLFMLPVIAQEQESVDFSDQMTAQCEVDGLVVEPPAGWINVPIDTGIDQLAGCQMMLVEDEILMGVLRILSFDWMDAPADLPPWQQHVMTVESMLIEAMGYQIVEPIWRRETVPISGPGFGNGRAMGFAVKIAGNDIPQESHMLVFDSGDIKYLVDLLTPAKSVNEGVYYSKNLLAMKAIMQGFKVPLSEQ